LSNSSMCLEKQPQSNRRILAAGWKSPTWFAIITQSANTLRASGAAILTPSASLDEWEAYYANHPQFWLCGVPHIDGKKPSPHLLAGHNALAQLLP
jgi:hypothetical protein